MSKFLICECCNQIYLEEDMSKNNKNMCCSCWCYTRPKDKRIAELEEQLKNSIRPEFKPHNDLFVIVWKSSGEYEIEQYYIDEIVIRGNGNYIEYRDINQKTSIGENNKLFATKEEAELKLKELQGE